MMRAKMRVTEVKKPYEGSEILKMNAVGGNGAYDERGSDEDNTYAAWTPMAELTMTINNPALHGKFAVGDVFYVDFTKADPGPLKDIPHPIKVG